MPAVRGTVVSYHGEAEKMDDPGEAKGRGKRRPYADTSK
jgi:hypothetical protein